MHLHLAARPPALPFLWQRWRALLVVLGLLCGLGSTFAQETCTITVSPEVVTTASAVGASVTGLRGRGYTLDWDDGSSTPFELASAQSVPKPGPYAAARTYVLTVQSGGAVVCRQPLSVTASRTVLPTLSVTPAQGLVGDLFTARVDNLPVALTAAYTLDWGDGSSAAAAATQTHRYAAAATYTVTLRTPTGAPVSVQPVTVTAPAPATLQVTPTSLTPGQQATATTTNLQPGDTLDWGDGAVVQAAATQNHSYAAAGSYTVRLLRATVVQGVAVVTVTLPAPTLNVTPGSGAPAQTFTASLGGLVVGVPYSLDWADGTVDTVTGSGTVTRTHVYAAPDTYAVKLSAPGAAPVVQAVTVAFPAPTLDAAPNPALVGQAVTATVGNPNPALSLDWGDGTTVRVAATQTHPYAAPGTYTLRLIQDGAPRRDVPPVVLNVTAPAPTLALAPQSTAPGQTVTATLGTLVSGLTYSLDWADGTVEQVTGSGTASRTHVYAAPGTFAVKLTAPGLAPAIQTVTVIQVPVTLGVTPSAALPGDTVTASVSGASRSVPYLLDWGDGSAPQPLTGSDAYTVKHAYTAPGVFVLRVSAASQVQATATVTVSAAVPTLEVTPTLGLVGDTVQAKTGNTRAGQSYTLDWGDGSTAAVTAASSLYSHVYAQPGSFPVKLGTPGVPPVVVPVVMNLGCTLTQTSPLVQAGQPSAFTLGGQPSASGSGLAGFPVGTAYTLDWGDGSAPLSGAASGSPQPLTHSYAAPGPVTLKVTVGSSTVCTLVVNVDVPLASLTVDAQRAGTPSTVALAGLVANLTYTLDFGDGVPPQPVSAAQPNVPHVYALAGTYPVKLTLVSGSSTRILATGVALVPAAYGTLQVQAEVRFAAQTGQPIPASGVQAPAPVSLKQNVQAASVLRVTAQGGGPLTVRWSWTATGPAAPASPAPATQVLDTRTVTLVPGDNTLTLPLPTQQAGVYVLKVELLGNPADPAQPVPVQGAGQVFVQTVTITAAPPATLLVGPVGNQFRFKVGALILKDAAHPAAPASFDPQNFWAELTPETPVMLGGLPLALTVQPGQALKISVDGDTATLLIGTVTAATTPGKPQPAGVLGGEPDSPNPSYALPALAPMRLKVGVVSFTPAGATLQNAIVTSPDYTQTNVSDWLKKLLGKWLDQKAGGAKPSTPGDIKQSVIDKVFDPFEGWAPSGIPGGAPILAPIQQAGGLVGVRSGVLLALGRPRPGQEQVGLFAQLPAVRPPANLTATGNGYGTYKGAALLDKVASAGVQTDYGVLGKSGQPLTDGAVLSGGQVFNPQAGGHFDLAGVLGGPIDVSELQTILGSGQHDFLTFPELYLNTQGSLVSAQTVNGVSQASLPTAVGMLGGDQKLGSDSGVSMKVASKPVIYLDLDPAVSVQPQGYAAGGNTDQASLLRQTYSGAPALVKVPDVGPTWQGLLWLSNTLTVSSVLDDGKGGAGKASGSAKLTSGYSVNLKAQVPVSFGLGGWNFAIDADTDGKAVNKVGGWDYRDSHINAAMVKSNLIRSERSGAMGPLAFVGGTVSAQVSGQKVTVKDTGLTRAFGPDGSFTAPHLSYSQEGQGNSAVGVFHLQGAAFDLTRIGAGLALKCSDLILDPALSSLKNSTCAYTGANGQRTVAGTRMNVTGTSLAQGKDGQGALVFGGDVLVGDTQSAPITASGAKLTLAADPDSYTLKLNTPAIDDFAVQNGTENGMKMTLPGKDHDLTGSGIAAIGAGDVGYANKELRFDTGSLAVGDTLTMQVKGLFGRQGGSYWYLLANGKFSNPCPTVLDVLYVCQLYGGLAYNMSWNGGQPGTVQFSALNTEPKRANNGLQLAAGVVGHIIDEQTVNVKGIVVISPAQLSLDFGGDVYLLKPIGGKPQGRFSGTLSKQGFLLNACIGPVAFNAPGGGTLNCSDLDRLNLAKVLYIQGGAKIAIGYGGHKYLYLGTYKQPIQADVDLKITKLQVTGYVMTGDLPTGPDGLPTIPGLQPGFGVAAGAAIDYTYHESGSESVLICTAKWHFDAHLYAAVNAVFTVSPAQLGGDMALGASASVGGSLCGVGGSVGASIDLKANFLLTPDAGNVDGSAHVSISLPVVPDVDATFGVHVKVY